MSQEDGQCKEGNIVYASKLKKVVLRLKDSILEGKRFRIERKVLSKICESVGIQRGQTMFRLERTFGEQESKNYCPHIT